MESVLLVFLFSDKVDTYINAISYSYEEMNVRAVKLIHVKGTDTGLSDSKASEISNRIWSRLSDLAFRFSGIYKQINERLLNRELIPVEYSDLKRELQLVINNQRKTECLVDLTSAPKRPSIDIFTVCLALGVESVYTFELIPRYDPSQPERFLYHALSKEEYSYACLSKTIPVKNSQSALLRKTYLFWYVGVTSLIVMLISLLVFVTIGPDSQFIQGLNLTAAIVGLVSPIFALINQQRKA